MKVLILSLTVGVGHNAVASVIANDLMQKGHDAKIIKMCDDFKFQNWINTKGNFKAAKYFPRLYKKVYDHYKVKDVFYKDSFFKKFDPYLIEQINEYQPDVILSTHVMGQVFSLLYKNKFHKAPKLYFIATDYELPPQVLKQNDFVIVADDYFVDMFCKKGYTKNQVLPFGIPIATQFANTHDKKQLQKQFGLRENVFTIMLMYGGTGIGNIGKIFKHLLTTPDDIQIIVVNGRNKKSYNLIEKLSKKTTKNIVNIGFSKEIDKLMEVSDVLITKTGCITVNEAISKSLPICTIKKMQEPEYSNMLFLQKHNAIIVANNYKTVYSAIKKANLAQIKNNVNKIYKPNTLKQITNHIIENAKK
jgi:processive 1,2-diacylglycerol beta-glucosyltransferase